MWIEKHRKVWRIREDIDGRKVTLQSGYATKTAATDAMTLMKADALRGDVLVTRGGERSLAAWLEAWWDDHALTMPKETSSVSTEGVMRRYILAMLGHLALDEVTPAVVQRWVADLLRGRTLVRHPRKLAPATVRNAHGLLHKVMADAVTARLIRHNPCERTNLPPAADREMRILTHAEAGRLVAAVPEHYRPMVVFLLATGVRWGEMLGVRLKNLDVLGCRVTIAVATQQMAGHYVDQEPKTRRSRRTLSYPKRVAEMLVPLAVGEREDRVFVGVRGGMVDRKRFYPIWHRATAEAGVSGLRIHDLRHTHISWLISAGVPLTAVSRRAGHASISITSDRYGHLLDEVDDRLIAAADQAMGMIDMGGIGGESVADSSPQESPTDPIGPAQDLSGLVDLGH